jgi:hypothetical protein
MYFIQDCYLMANSKNFRFSKSAEPDEVTKHLNLRSRQCSLSLKFHSAIINQLRAGCTDFGSTEYFI